MSMSFPRPPHKWVYNSVYYKSRNVRVQKRNASDSLTSYLTQSRWLSTDRIRRSRGKSTRRRSWDPWKKANPHFDKGVRMKEVMCILLIFLTHLSLCIADVYQWEVDRLAHVLDRGSLPLQYGRPQQVSLQLLLLPALITWQLRGRRDTFFLSFSGCVSMNEHKKIPGVCGILVCGICPHDGEFKYYIYM